MSSAFWVDSWTGSSPFAVRYPGLYALSRTKLISVSQQLGGNIQLLSSASFCWNRRLRLGESEQLDCQIPSTGGKNILKSRDVSFSIQQLNTYTVNNIFFPTIWKFKVPPRIQFFSWLLAYGRIFSNASLVARGILNPYLIGCLVCQVEESSMHIICYCCFAWKFSCYILARCDITLVSPPSVDIFFSIWSSLSHSSFKDIWRLIWFFGIWELWKSRNNRVFNDLENSHESLAYLC
ncbi:uncharacterized protein LOC126662042 [Mercurialis annua]|uniref:uncharacterized protein LOC126662042 n=1 Tax=Mercurialis annua TaxID=3986 RepID=UPI00215E4621|nr:uncharacterized protein LOC126662042 [Mercurialis annua]